MNAEVTTVSKVEKVDVDEKEVYDIGMVETPHTFFANDILVHNSVFYPAYPIVKSMYEDADKDDESFMTEKILGVAKNVQSYLNNCYDLFAKHFLYIPHEKHWFEIKQELIARSGLWVRKKRYAQWIINEEGHKVDKLDVKGLDIVRSDFPPAFKNLLEDIIISMLNGVPSDDIDAKIIDFKADLRNRELIEIARPTGVKNVSKYDMGEFGKRQKGTPAHVKAALSYNDLIDYLGIEKTAPKILDGEKIKWIYLKKNRLGFNEMAFKGVDDPEKVMEFINKYADYEKIFEKELKTKLEAIYEAIGWEYPSANKQQMKQFFAF